MKSKWVVSLNNGETFSEDKPIGNPGRSPWLNLVDYILKENLEVRHIKAIVNGITFNSPTFGALGKYPNKGGAHSLWVGHRAALLIGSSRGNMQENCLDISYLVGEGKDASRHHLIIDEDTCESWQSTEGIVNGTDKFIVNYCERFHDGKKWK